MHPIIFQTKHFTLHTFWIFFAIAIIVSTYTIIKLSKKNNLKIQFLSDNAIKLIFIAIVGARVLTVITNYQTYFYELSAQALLSVFYFWDKGLNAWGGILAFLIALYLICKKSEQNFWKWLDVIVPSLILGIAITSLGAFFDGIHYGKETGLPWGVNFESPSIKYTVPIHPTQIYSFIYSIIIGITLLVIDQGKKLKDGSIALFGILSYGLFRFLEEFVRGDDTWIIFGIRLPQILAALAIIISGIFLLIRYTSRTKSKKSKRKKK